MLLPRRCGKIASGFVSRTMQTAPIRSFRERVIQTCADEVGGIVLFTPILAFVTGDSTTDSVTVLLALSVTAMIWMGFYNTAFDWVEARLTSRKASDRPQRWRIVHAIGTEFTSILVSTPVLVLVGGYGWVEALMLDIGLSIGYALYAYVFHMTYDRLRPVRD